MCRDGAGPTTRPCGCLPDKAAAHLDVVPCLMGLGLVGGGVVLEVLPTRCFSTLKVVALDAPGALLTSQEL